MEFDVSADQRMKMKENKKMDKYLDPAWELKDQTYWLLTKKRTCWISKKTWNIKVTAVPIVIGALGTLHKGLVKRMEELEIGGRAETNYNFAKIDQNTEMSPGDLRRLAVTCCHSNFRGKPSADAVVKNSQKAKYY